MREILLGGTLLVVGLCALILGLYVVMKPIPLYGEPAPVVNPFKITH